jgi:hypothetical protein
MNVTIRKVENHSKIEHQLNSVRAIAHLSWLKTANIITTRPLNGTVVWWRVKMLVIVNDRATCGLSRDLREHFCDIAFCNLIDNAMCFVVGICERLRKCKFASKRWFENCDRESIANRNCRKKYDFPRIGDRMMTSSSQFQEQDDWRRGRYRSKCVWAPVKHSASPNSTSRVVVSRLHIINQSESWEKSES